MRLLLKGTVLVLIVSIVLLPNGCATGSGGGAGGDGDTVRLDGETYKVRDIRKGGQSLRITEKEQHRIRESVAEMFTRFASDDPKEWRKVAKKLRMVGSEYVPDVIMERVQAATRQGPEGAKAREQLARWGKLKSIVLQLPARNPKTWERVRKKMLSEGADAREMFLQHMIDFLRKPDRNRSRAAKQIARIGKTPVNNAWESMKNLAQKAKRVADRGKSLKGAMVFLVGLAEIQVYAGNWQRIRRALQHQRFRVRGAMAQAIARAEDESRVIKLLGNVVEQDPNSWVRNEAVSSLGVFKTRKDPIPHLKVALTDQNVKVARSAAEKLRYFHNHEQEAIKALLDGLEAQHGNPERKKVSDAIYNALQKLANDSSVENSYSAWLSWYRATYR